MEYKITTHTLGNGWYTVEINGIPLIGLKGYPSRYKTRREAKKAAEKRLKDLTPEDIKEIFNY